MTCIAGLIDRDGKGHIASDSLGSNGYTKGVYKNAKIFKKGNVLFGYTSSYRMGQLLEYGLTLPERKVNQSLEEYIYMDFVESVRSLLKSSGYLIIDNNSEVIGQFIVIIEGRIFKIQEDLALLEPSEPFDTCGSGEDYAKSAIDILKTHTKLSSKKILTLAIETASKYVATVGGEVRYLHE